VIKLNNRIYYHVILGILALFFGYIVSAAYAQEFNCDSWSCTQSMVNNTTYWDCNYNNCTKQPNFQLNITQCPNVTVNSTCIAYNDTTLMSMMTDFVTKTNSTIESFNLTKMYGDLQSDRDKCSGDLSTCMAKTAKWDSMVNESASCSQNYTLLMKDYNVANAKVADLEGGRTFLFGVGLLIGVLSVYIYITRVAKPSIGRHEETVRITGETPLFNPQQLESDARRRQQEAEVRGLRFELDSLKSELSRAKTEKEQLTEEIKESKPKIKKRTLPKKPIETVQEEEKEEDIY